MEKEKVSSGNIIDWKVVKRILQFIQPYKGRFYFLIFLTILLGVLTPLRPLLIQYTLDAHVAVGDYWSLVYIIILILVLLVLQSGVQYVHTFLSGQIGQYVIRDIRVQLYKHIVNLRLKFFDKTPIGRLVT
ncbi:MAG TPA: ABC transporter transmembrane domain-containing protein, partial [Cyclobacteriaceae bacterium]|nr:ABC transporter transmembrane domain-containing protein [Cyclobacteriaceae bacterium]